MHECPICGQACDCSGDIDDIPVYTQQWVYQNCRHDCDPEDCEPRLNWWEECPCCLGRGELETALYHHCDGSGIITD